MVLVPCVNCANSWISSTVSKISCKNFRNTLGLIHAESLQLFLLKEVMYEQLLGYRKYISHYNSWKLFNLTEIWRLLFILLRSCRIDWYLLKISTQCLKYTNNYLGCCKFLSKVLLDILLSNPKPLILPWNPRNVHFWQENSSWFRFFWKLTKLAQNFKLWALFLPKEKEKVQIIQMCAAKKPRTAQSRRWLSIGRRNLSKFSKGVITKFRLTEAKSFLGKALVFLKVSSIEKVYE